MCRIVLSVSQASFVPSRSFLFPRIKEWAKRNVVQNSTAAALLWTHGGKCNLDRRRRRLENDLVRCKRLASRDLVDHLRFNYLRIIQLQFDEFLDFLAGLLLHHKAAVRHNIHQ